MGLAYNLATTSVKLFMISSSDFGNRPRKLYVVINLSSGDGPSSVNKIWQKVLRMFQMAGIHTDVLRKLMN
jgi:hypothetical protein